MARWILLLLLFVPQDPDVDTLIKQLEDESALTREEAVKALIEVGDKAVPKLKALKESSQGTLRKMCGDILERIAIPRPLRGHMPPLSRVTIDAKDQAFKTVLKEFQLQTLFPLQIDRNTSTKPITVRVTDMAPLEALTAICNAAGVSWEYHSYSMDGGMEEYVDPEVPDFRLLEGPLIEFVPRGANYPRLFVRHYMVECGEIALTRTNDFRQGKSSGVLGFRFTWPPGVKPHVVQFEVNSVKDDRGAELFIGHDDPREPRGPRQELTWAGYSHRLYHRYRIRYPDRGVKALQSIRGTARIQFLVREKRVRFETPEKAVGVRKEVEGVVAEIVEVKPMTAGTITYQKTRIQVTGRASLYPIRVWATLESGKTVPIGAASVPDSDSLYEIYLHSPESPVVSIEVAVDADCAEDKVDFEFKDIALP